MGGGKCGCCASGLLTAYYKCGHQRRERRKKGEGCWRAKGKVLGVQAVCWKNLYLVVCNAPVIRVRRREWKQRGPTFLLSMGASLLPILPLILFLDGCDAAPFTQVSGGEWQQQGSTLSFHFETPGFERGDVSLPPGRVYVNVPVWGSLLSKDKGEGREQ